MSCPNMDDTTPDTPLGQPTLRHHRRAPGITNRYGSPLRRSPARSCQTCLKGSRTQSQFNSEIETPAFR